MKNIITLEQIIKDFGEIPLCSCGCGNRVNIDPKRYWFYQHQGYPKYIKGHQGKYVRTKEQRKCISQTLINKHQSSWCKGLTKDTDERVNKISEKLKNKEFSKEHKYKIKISKILKLSDGSYFPSIPNLCHCGCREIVYGGKKYVYGHGNKIINIGRKRPDNIKLIISKSNKDRIWKKESKEKLSKSLKGKNTWSKGRKFTPEQKEKHLKNVPRGDKHPKYWLGKHISDETKDKIKQNSLHLSGSNHWNWQGGITSLKIQIINSEMYNNWRTQIFIRDNRCCTKCSSTQNIQAHHITQIAYIINKHNITTIEEAKNCQDLWDINNGITLCEDCHKLIPTIRKFKIKITKGGRASAHKPKRNKE